jgi:tRNA/tmRNA/rRNA uracil-C5-methylase (TrmA/RlmC/RlmD family)
MVLRKLLLHGIRRRSGRKELEESIRKTLGTEEFLLSYKSGPQATLFAHTDTVPEVVVNGKRLKIREAGQEPARKVVDVVTPLNSMEYTDQIEVKRKRLQEFVCLFGSVGGNVAPVVEEAPLRTGYRNKCEFTFGFEGEQPTLGFRAGKYTHSPNSVENPSTCIFNVSAEMLSVVSLINKLLAETRDAVYDRIRNKGFLKVLMLRKIGDDLAALVQMHASSADEVPREVLSLIESFPVESIFLQTSSARFEGFNTSPLLKLRGKDEFCMHFSQCVVKVSLLSFFQVNLLSAERMVSYLASKISEDVLLDLCCGSGSLGVAISRRRETKKIVGIEIERSSVQDAMENAKRNGVNAEYHCGRVEEILPTLSIPAGSSAVLDPPRSGVGSRLIRFLRGERRVSEIFYVSCSYRSIQKNIKELLDGQVFSLSSVWAVDMFPHTNEVECVFHFKRNTFPSDGGMTASQITE